MACAAPNPLHWVDVRGRSMDQVLRRPGVKTATQGNGYEVEFLNARYLVDPVAERIRELYPKPERDLAEEFQILLIRYLVAEYGGPLDGETISEKDLPGGVTFFQGPHALHVAPLVKRFGSDPDGFAAAGERLGAVPVAMGDKGLRFFPFPLIPVTYVLWREDEEFPASMTVLFDRSIARWFELDMIFTVVLVLTERIVEKNRSDQKRDGPPRHEESNRSPASAPKIQRRRIRD